MKYRHSPPEFIAPLVPVNAPVDRCPVASEQATRRILIMRVGAHGDILMGTPLLAALRRADPRVHLTWIVEHNERGVIDANPYIDELIVWDSVYWKKMLRRGLYPLWLNRALAFQRALRRRQYDVFISFQPEEWPLLVRGVGAPVSVGVFDTLRRYYRAMRTSPHTRLYTHAYAHPDLPPHRIDQYLLALDALGLSGDVDKQMNIGYTQEDADAVTCFLRDRGVGEGERCAVLAPLTTWPSKCWPGERYAELGERLTREHGLRIVLIGSAKEERAVAEIAALLPTAPLTAAGAFTFRQMAALLARASLVVSGDTGPMHVAAAVGTPRVSLFGSTAPEWYAPQAGPGVSLIHPVPCGPCDQKFCPNVGEDHLRCQRLLTVEEVFRAASALLLAAPVLQ